METVYNLKISNKKMSLLRKNIIIIILKIIFLCGFLYFVFFGVFRIYRVTDNTMYPSIREGDIVLSIRWDRSFTSNDVVLLSVNGEIQVRRIVGVSNDKIDINSDGLEINGNLQNGLESSYIFKDTSQFVEGISFPISVKEGNLFVLSDNRTEGMDSRIYGTVPEKKIIGKIIASFRIRGF